MYPKLVFLVDSNGQMINPTRKVDMVNRWIKSLKAKIIGYYGKHMIVQVFKKLSPDADSPEYWLGVDPGDTVGVALVRLTKHKVAKLIYKAQAELRSKQITKLLTDRRGYRGLRRYFRRKRIRRRSWTPKYRPARFNNRKRSEKWLAPSVRHLLESHKRLIADFIALVPNLNVSVEYAKFDINRMQDPNIEGEGYQHGRMFGYENMRAYVLDRDGYKCQLCGAKQDLHLHHIVPRSKGGVDRPENLITLCSECHSKVHNDLTTYTPILKQKVVHNNDKYNATSRLNIIMPFLKKWLYSVLPKERIWFGTGADTAKIRYELSIPKSHDNDAYCIAVNKLFRYYEDIKYRFVDMLYSHWKQIREHNRKLTNSLRTRRYYLIKDRKRILIAKNRKGSEESFDKIDKNWLNEQLRNGYTLKVYSGRKGFRTPFSKVGFKEGALVRYDNRVYVVKGYSVTGGYVQLYGLDKNIKLKDIEAINPFGGLRCIGASSSTG